MIKEMFGGMFGNDSIDYKDASVQETHDAVEKADAQLVDVRTIGEFVYGYAESAVNVPLDVLARNVENFDKEKPVYVICQSGVRSQTGAIIFLRAGFKEVYNVVGGTKAWVAANLPIER